MPAWPLAGDRDAARADAGWDQVWADPEYQQLADHLGLDADPVPDDPAYGRDHACAERAAELLELTLAGRDRVGGAGPLFDPDLEAARNYGGVRDRLETWTRGLGGRWLGGCFGPPQQPRVLFLALSGRAELWTTRPAWQEAAAAVGVVVDDPLRGMSSKEAADFVQQCVADVPAGAREQLADFAAEWRAAFPGLDELEEAAE